MKHKITLLIFAVLCLGVTYTVSRKLAAQPYVNYIHRRLWHNLQARSTVKALLQDTPELTLKSNLYWVDAGRNIVTLSERQTQAWRRDGSYVDSREALFNPGATHRRTMDLITEGLQIKTLDDMAVKSTMALGDPTEILGKRQKSPKHDCLVPVSALAQTNGIIPPGTKIGAKVLREENILGYPTKVQLFDNSGQMMWRAPSLGCVRLKMYTPTEPAIYNGKPVVGVLEDPVELVLGTPDPALFDTSNYKEEKPSDLMIDVVHFTAKTRGIFVGDNAPEILDAKTGQRWKNADADYAARRPRM